MQLFCVWVRRSVEIEIADCLETKYVLRTRVHMSTAKPPQKHPWGMYTIGIFLLIIGVSWTIQYRRAGFFRTRMAVFAGSEAIAMIVMVFGVGLAMLVRAVAISRRVLKGR